MPDTGMLALLHEVADAVASALASVPDWGPAGTRAGQYHTDLAADAAAVAVLERAGVGILSEESGRHRPDAPVTVVVDPVDGSTNAARGIPWYATSLCAVDGEGPLAALVVNLATGTRYAAGRGKGATRDGVPMKGSGGSQLSEAIIGVTGLPGRHHGWRQFRALGAMALDLCAVASGTFDGYVSCVEDAHGPWDYLGGLLVCREAGVVVGDLTERELVVLEHDARRTPVAAATATLYEELVAAAK